MHPCQNVRAGSNFAAYSQLFAATSHWSSQIMTNNKYISSPYCQLLLLP